MSENKQLSEELPADEIGILITRPRAYRRLRALLLLRRSRALYAELAARTGATPGAAALDIGCGPGDLVAALADRVGPHGTVLGIDPAPQMVEYAAARAARPHCRFEAGAAQDLALPDASIDVITSTFVMHHIPQARRADALANMYRILRPGGTLLLADTHPSGPVLPTLIRVMSRSAARRTGDQAAARDDDRARHTDDPAPRVDDPATGRPDPLAAVDIRRYRPDLAGLGFTSIEFRTITPSTGILTARKPTRSG
ncbi:class I SAM-dependent methyltransferase [Nocardia shimofusensis]|uniref:class I SAM-dependent methyltransferase n=1 Tax=Nocardia shimofusensis TaxID=228596 RepID=UPI00083787FD|nr:class I SAM-dependent methyltransferase [Nocardia shimofusensis]